MLPLILSMNLSIGLSYGVMVACLSYLAFMTLGGPTQVVDLGVRVQHDHVVRVLAADDNAIDLAAMRRMISKVLPHAETVFASSWVEALQHTSQGERFDLALLDLDMTNGSGTELALELRDRQAARLIIAITGARRHPCDACGVKAFDQIVGKDGLEEALGGLQLLASC